MAAMTSEQQLEEERERKSNVPICAVLPISHLNEALRSLQKPLGLGAYYTPTCYEPLENGEVGERSFDKDAYDRPLVYVTTKELLDVIGKLREVPVLVQGVKAFVTAYQERYGDVWDVWILWWG
jgi:hypothetical protein